MTWNEKIKFYREQIGYTQRDLAGYLGVEPGTISKYELGLIEPKIDNIKILSELFGVSIDELLSNSEDKNDISNLNILTILKEQKDMKLKGNLYHNTQITFAYNTNHIEGSKLSEEQTRNIYETNTIISDSQNIINVDDITETTNHFRLVDYMLDNCNKKLSEKMIKEFHKILKEGTSDSKKDWFNVGEYKSLPNETGGTKTTTPANVSKEMLKLLDWYNSLKKITIKEIIEFHYRFEKIHPFQDGNGRVGRIIAFKECLKNNIMPFIIQDNNKLFYYRGLKLYKEEKGYLIDTCLDAQDKYASMVKQYIN